MSTYYHFVCKECNEKGGFLSRQAWGTGNFDIIETFKSLAVHKDHKPILHCKHDDGGEPDISRSKKSKAKFVEESKGMMPHSNDWELVEENDWSKVDALAMIGDERRESLR